MTVCVDKVLVGLLWRSTYFDRRAVTCVTLLVTHSYVLSRDIHLRHAKAVFDTHCHRSLYLGKVVARISLAAQNSPAFDLDRHVLPLFHVVITSNVARSVARAATLTILGPSEEANTIGASSGPRRCQRRPLWTHARRALPRAIGCSRGPRRSGSTRSARYSCHAGIGSRDTRATQD